MRHRVAEIRSQKSVSQDCLGQTNPHHAGIALPSDSGPGHLEKGYSRRPRSPTSSSWTRRSSTGVPSRNECFKGYKGKRFLTFRSANLCTRRLKLSPFVLLQVQSNDRTFQADRCPPGTCTVHIPWLITCVPPNLQVGGG